MVFLCARMASSALALTTHALASTIRIGMLQLNGTALDAAGRVAKTEKYVREAALPGVHIVVTPAKWLLGGSMAVDPLREVARSTGVVIAAAVEDNKSGREWFSLVLPSGSDAFTYSKASGTSDIPTTGHTSPFASATASTGGVPVVIGALLGSDVMFPEQRAS